MSLGYRAVRFIGLVLFLIPLCGLEPGQRAPSFANPDLQKKYVLSKEILGKGWLILDFFATDCEGCKKELPVLERLFAEFHPLGLEILVFATDERGHEVVEPYFQNSPTSLTVLIDRYKVAAKKYGVSEIPSLFLVNAEGEVVYKEVGYKEELYERIRAFVLAEH